MSIEGFQFICNGAIIEHKCRCGTALTGELFRHFGAGANREQARSYKALASTGRITNDMIGSDRNFRAVI